MPRLGVSLAFGVAAMSTLLGPSGASAYCRMTTAQGPLIGSAQCSQAGVPLEWDTTCLTYAVDAAGSQWMSFAEAEAAVDAGFLVWTEVECDAGPTDLAFQPLEASTCQKAEYNDEGGNVNTIAFLDPWVDPGGGGGLPRQALAVTVVWHNERTGRILDADMLINDTRRLCPAEQAGCGGFDVQSIVSHESGHFLGIGHSEFQEATMYFMSPRIGDTSMRSLWDDDIEALCAIYPSGTEGVVCEAADFEPLGGLELDCEPPEPVEPPEACEAGDDDCDDEPPEEKPEPPEGGDESSEVDLPAVDPDQDGGSGCAVTRARRAQRSWSWALLGLAVLLGRRRRLKRRV